MKDTKPWLRGARLGAAAILGLGLVMPAVTACSSSSGDETEQVEEDSGDSEDSGDTEETDPEPDIEE
ncbi:MAG: hypothetical protein RLZ94_2278 [Actinomycetota bacterium]|jgi:hypothetical protein